MGDGPDGHTGGDSLGAGGKAAGHGVGAHKATGRSLAEVGRSLGVADVGAARSQQAAVRSQSAAAEGHSLRVDARAADARTAAEVCEVAGAHTQQGADAPEALGEDSLVSVATYQAPDVPGRVAGRPAVDGHSLPGAADSPGVLPQAVRPGASAAKTAAFGVTGCCYCLVEGTGCGALRYADLAGAAGTLRLWEVAPRGWQGAPGGAGPQRKAHRLDKVLAQVCVFSSSRGELLIGRRSESSHVQTRPASCPTGRARTRHHFYPGNTIPGLPGPWP
mmetsp:Transcript_53450/g.124470  ORF Transcript_53450/g.124470 Transcript_53450/m.124470 type:complete len:276 (-) Transcript_53450:93-920(-)